MINPRLPWSGDRYAGHQHRYPACKRGTMEQHQATPPTVDDQQLEHEFATERGPVDAYQNAVLTQQVTDDLRLEFAEVSGAPPIEIAVIAGAEAAGSNLTVPRGRYVFTPSQIEEQLKMCDELIEGLYEHDLYHARKITEVTPPAPDKVASVPNAEAIVALGYRLIERIENQIAFIENWADQLRTVRQRYLDQEGNTVETWKGLSGGLYT